MISKKALRTDDYLAHMLEAIRRIDEYVTDLDEVSFINSTLAQDAVIRNFEIIGEAARNILRHDPTFSDRYPDLPLEIAYEMRNSLAHGYFKVDLTIVWNTIERDLPLLNNLIKTHLA